MTSKKPHESRQADTPPPTQSEDSRLDEALEESFPASDPIAIDPDEPSPAPAKGTSSGAKKRH
jgi:hypothetical protein